LEVLGLWATEIMQEE